MFQSADIEAAVAQHVEPVAGEAQGADPARGECEDGAHTAVLVADLDAEGRGDVKVAQRVEGEVLGNGARQGVIVRIVQPVELLARRTGSVGEDDVAEQPVRVLFSGYFEFSAGIAQRRNRMVQTGADVFLWSMTALPEKIVPSESG